MKSIIKRIISEDIAPFTNSGLKFTEGEEREKLCIRQLIMN